LPDCPPVTADTYIVLARALAAAGRSAEAVAEYERAIATASDTPAVAPMELAWLLATNPDDGSRDGARAVSYAEQAVNYGRALAAAGGVALRAGLDVRLVKTHAAALAEAGRFDEASAVLRAGAALFTPEQWHEVEPWIAAFAARRPVRDDPKFP
jgi:hypothetical protein